MHSHRLPESIVIHSLSFLEFQDIVQCRRVCSHFKQYVDSSAQLRYAIALGANGLQDPNFFSSPTSYSLRGQQLAGTQQRWRNLAWTRPHVIELPGPGLNLLAIFSCSGNKAVFAISEFEEDPDVPTYNVFRFYTITLDDAEHVHGTAGNESISEELFSWELDWPEYNSVELLCLDIVQDLLVLKTFSNWEDDEPEYHILCLSTGSRHPQVRGYDGVLRPRSTVHESLYASIEAVLSGNLFVLVMPIDLGQGPRPKGYPLIIIIWDIWTGKLRATSKILDVESISIALLGSQCLVAAAVTTDPPDKLRRFVLDIYDIPPPTDSKTDAARVLSIVRRYELPELADYVRNASPTIQVVSQRNPQDDDKASLSDEPSLFNSFLYIQLYVTAFMNPADEYAQSRTHLLCVPTSCLLNTLPGPHSLVTSDEGQPFPSIKWADWGPSSTRLFALHGSRLSDAVSAFVAHGSRVLIHSNPDPTVGGNPMKLLDFNKYRIREFTLQCSSSSGQSVGHKADTQTHSGPLSASTQTEENPESRRPTCQVITSPTTIPRSVSFFAEDIMTSLPYMESVCDLTDFVPVDGFALPINLIIPNQHCIMLYNENTQQLHVFNLQD